MIATDVMPRLAEARLAGQRDGLCLMLHPHAPRWIVLNSVGLAVARLCDGTRTVSEVADAVGRRWSQPTEGVLADVEACVARLAEAGFLDLTLQPLSPDGSGVSNAPSSLPGEGAGVGAPAWRLHLYLTEDCNLFCRHCGVAGGPAAGARLDADFVRNLIDLAVAAGAEGIAFSGGEPLLHRDLLALLAYAAPRLKTLLATNALLVDDTVADALARLGVIVQVSLDGPDAATHDCIRGAGAFERAWRGIECLQRAGIGERLALNVTLMRPNIGRLPELVELAERRGVPGLRFTALQRMGRAAGQWAALAPTIAESAAAYRYLYRCRPAAGMTLSPGLLGLELAPPDRGMWCGLGRTLLVDARGEIYPCGLFVGPEFRLGNVRQVRLADALASDRLAQLIVRCEARRDAIPECRACVWKHFCQAGCAGSVWQLRGTLGATDGLCVMRRELFSTMMLDQAETHCHAIQVEAPFTRRAS